MTNITYIIHLNIELSHFVEELKCIYEKYTDTCTYILNLLQFASDQNDKSMNQSVNIQQIYTGIINNSELKLFRSLDESIHLICFYMLDI